MTRNSIIIFVTLLVAVTTLQVAKELTLNTPTPITSVNVVKIIPEEYIGNQLLKVVATVPEQFQVLETYKAMQIMDIVKCESGFKNITHVNRDGSYDRGYWQLNSFSHSEVSDDCAYNLQCSTKEALRILRERGMREWVCDSIVNE